MEQDKAREIEVASKIDMDEISMNEYKKRIEDRINRIYYISSFNKFCDLIEKKEFFKLHTNAFYIWLDKYLDELFDADEDIVPDVIYRSRKIQQRKIKDVVKIDNMDGFGELESREPPNIKILKNGRCNSKEESIFYAADNEYTALTEIRPSYCDLISLSRFRKIRKIKIADFTKLKKQTSKDIYFSSKLIDIFSVLNNDEIYYTISNFIKQKVQEKLFEGIKYYSSIGCGNNYAFFNGSADKLDWIDSKVVFTKQISFKFYDLKNDTSLTEDSKQELSKGQIIECIKKLSENKY